MKSWSDINISKKTMVDNLKISFFNQDFQNIQIYICEFIVNKQADLLLETLIELYCDYYPSLNQKTLIKFNNCIDVVKNKNKNLYLSEERSLFNELANDLNNLIKSQNLYKKKYETKLNYDSSIIINKLNKINYNIWNEIKLYLPNDQHKYYLELIYLLSSNNKEQFNNLLNTIINKFNKTKLLKNVDAINQNFNDTYVLVFFELFKKYKSIFNDYKINNYYDLCYNIFNFKLKKSNVNNRLSIIFLLFNLLFADNTRNTYYCSKNKLDINYINEIYNKLINFYELPKVIKKKEKKKKNNNFKETISSSSDDNNKNNNKLCENECYVDYLYTIINFNNKEYKKKLNKVEYNKNSLKKYKSNKPVNISGDEKIFSSYIKNDINIIKLHNKYYS